MALPMIWVWKMWAHWTLGKILKPLQKITRSPLLLGSQRRGALGLGVWCALPARPLGKPDSHVGLLDCIEAKLTDPTFLVRQL